MRLLGVDFGFKRIGVAVAVSEPEIVTARPSMAASGKLESDAARIVDLARKEEVDAIVLGMPLEANGEEGRMARICRTLAGHIRDGGFEVHLADETLTSVEADRNLRSGDESLTAARRRKLKDGEAARLILQRYLQERNRE